MRVFRISGRVFKLGYVVGNYEEMNLIRGGVECRGVRGNAL